MPASPPLDWQRYEALVLEALEIAPVEQERLPEGALLVRATFHPTFHDDCGLELLALGDLGELRMHIAGAGTRAWAMASIAVRGMGTPQKPPPAYRARVDVPAPRLRAFLAGIAALPVDSRVDVDETARDGMTVHGALRDAERLTTFHLRLTEAAAQRPHARLIDTLWDLAAELLADERSRRCLNEVRGYFPRA